MGQSAVYTRKRKRKGTELVLFLPSGAVVGDLAWISQLTAFTHFGRPLVPSIPRTRVLPPLLSCVCACRTITRSDGHALLSLSFFLPFYFYFFHRVRRASVRALVHLSPLANGISVYLPF